MPSTGSRYEDPHYQTGRSYESVSRPVVTEEGDAGASGCAAPAQSAPTPIAPEDLAGLENSMCVCARSPHVGMTTYGRHPQQAFFGGATNEDDPPTSVDLVVDRAQRSLADHLPQQRPHKKYSHTHKQRVKTVLSSYTCLHHYFAIRRRGALATSAAWPPQQLARGFDNSVSAAAKTDNLNRRRGVSFVSNIIPHRETMCRVRCVRERERDG